MNIPPDVIETVWSALKHRCAAHPPEEHGKVKRLVMVNEADIRAALAALADSGWVARQADDATEVWRRIADRMNSWARHMDDETTISTVARGLSFFAEIIAQEMKAGTPALPTKDTSHG